VPIAGPSIVFASWLFVLPIASLIFQLALQIVLKDDLRFARKLAAVNDVGMAVLRR
jgi:hypothetical protein